MARRNRMAREYSRLVHKRRQAATKMLEADAAALRVAREVTEMAPPGIAYLTLSGDMRGLVLYASQSARALLVGSAMEEGLLGRYAVRVWVEWEWNWEWSVPRPLLILRLQTNQPSGPSTTLCTSTTWTYGMSAWRS